MPKEFNWLFKKKKVLRYCYSPCLTANVDNSWAKESHHYQVRGHHSLLQYKDLTAGNKVDFIGKSRENVTQKD